MFPDGSRQWWSSYWTCFVFIRHITFVVHVINSVCYTPSIGTFFSKRNSHPLLMTTSKFHEFAMTTFCCNPVVKFRTPRNYLTRIKLDKQ